jgi:hypothetical protein
MRRAYQETYRGGGQREKYEVAGTAARDAIARLQVCKAHARAEGGKPKASWDAVLLAYVGAITSYSRTCDEVSVKAIARSTGLTANTVRAAMRDLQEMGCIMFDTPTTEEGQGRRTRSTVVSLPMSPERHQQIMEGIAERERRNGRRVDNRGEGAIQTAGGRVQSRLHPSEKYEKNLNPKNARARQSRIASHSPAYAVATEHLVIASKAPPPKDMTPEKVKAREAIQREIDERRSRPPGYAVKAAHTHDDRGTNGNGNGHPAGDTNTTAQAINTPPAIHENADHSWIEDAGEIHREADAMRDRFDALAEMPRGW